MEPHKPQCSDGLTTQSPHVKQQDSTTTSTKAHAIKLCKVLKHFGRGRMPSTLFGRAVSNNPCWTLEGDIEWKQPIEHSVPACLLALFDQPAAVSRNDIHNSWQCSFLQIQYFEGFQHYTLVPSLQNHEDLKCMDQEYEALLLDTVSILVHAFPDIYAETGWEETESQLQQVIESVYPLIALDPKYKFLEILKTIEPRALTEYLCKLLRMLIRCLSLIWSPPPSSLKLLISEIFNLLKAIGSAEKAEPLRLRYLCHKWETLIAHDSFLEHFRDERSLDADEWATGAVIFILNQTGTIGDKSLITFANSRMKPISGTKPMGRLRETIVWVREGNHDRIQLYSISTDQQHVGVMIGTILVQHKAYHLAARNFRQVLAELTPGFEHSHTDYAVSCVEYANCCNIIGNYSEAESWALSALEKRWAIDDAGYIFRETSLKMALADSYICAAKYLEAARMLKSIKLCPSMMPVSVFVGLTLRLTRVERRLGNQRQAIEPGSALTAVAESMHKVTGELLLKCVEEVLCNVRLLDAGLNPSSSQTHCLQSLVAKAKHAVNISSPSVDVLSDWRLEELEDLDLTATSDRFSLSTTLAAPSSRSLTLLGNQSLMSLPSTRLRDAATDSHGPDAGISERESLPKATSASVLPPDVGIRSHETTAPNAKISGHGISEVYRPVVGIDIIAQIIFVHGLMGDSRESWTYTRPAPRDKKYTSKVYHMKQQQHFWPADFLPHISPSVQILTWDCPSSERSWLSASQSIFRRNSQKLLLDIIHFRTLTNATAPIIFVAHSVGGLIVKDALSVSFKATDTRTKAISLHTHGICFLGTPHHGSTASIRKLALPIDAMVKDQDFDNRDHRDFEFRYLLREMPVQVCTFIEEKATKRLGLVVPKFSAIIGLASEVVVSLPTDHANMTKFSSEDDVSYRRISSQLQRWIANIEMQNRLPTEDKDHSSRLLASLCGPSTQQQHQRLQTITDVASGTYKWVFDRTQASFSDWLKEGGGPTDTPYWIKGKPGSGKTTLMNHIFREQRTLELLKGTSNAPWILVGFSFVQRLPMTCEDVLQHILYQIIIQSPHMRIVVDQFYQLAVEKQGTSLPK